jgi:translation initiation factor IF-3
MKLSIRINENIVASEVMVIDEKKNLHKSVPITQALKMAQDLGLDLIEINPQAKPPVCKIVDLEEYMDRASKLPPRH